MDAELLLIIVASLAFWVLVLLTAFAFTALRRLSRVLEAAIERGYALPGASAAEAPGLASGESIDDLRTALKRIEARQDRLEGSGERG